MLWCTAVLCVLHCHIYSDACLWTHIVLVCRLTVRYFYDSVEVMLMHIIFIIIFYFMTKAVYLSVKHLDLAPVIQQLWLGNVTISILKCISPLCFQCTSRWAHPPTLQLCDGMCVCCRVACGCSCRKNLNLFDLLLDMNCATWPADSRQLLQGLVNCTSKMSFQTKTLYGEHNKIT